MSTRKLFIAALSVTLGVGALAARAEDWPRFRGANLDNISKETGLLKQWPAGGPKLLWKAEGLGQGLSSVSSVGGKLYTMGDLDNSAFLICLDSSGKQLWKTRVGAAGGGDQSPGRPGPRCTPTVDGDRVYTLGQHGNLLCASAADGKVLWTRDLQKDFGGRKGRWDYAESPLVDGDRLIVTPGGAQGTLAALNKMNGEVIWRTAEWKDGAEYVTPIIATIDGVKQYIQFTQQNIAGVSPDDGRILWLAPRAGRTAIASSPVYADNTLLVSSGYGVGGNGFKITSAGGKFTAEQIYASREIASHHGGIVLHEGHAYLAADNGSLMCVNLKTGEVAWKERLFKGSLTLADGMLFVRSEGGPLALVEANPKAYTLKGEFDQPDRSGRPAWPYPVVSNGKLYIRDQNVLLCYDVKSNPAISRAD